MDVACCLLLAGPGIDSRGRQLPDSRSGVQSNRLDCQFLHPPRGDARDLRSHRPSSGRAAAQFGRRRGSPWLDQRLDGCPAHARYLRFQSAIPLRESAHLFISGHTPCTVYLRAQGLQRSAIPCLLTPGASRPSQTRNR